MRGPYDTGYPAASVEFCPSVGAQNILACGTYKLVEPTEAPGDAIPPDGRKQTRLGKCLIFDVTLEEEVEQELRQLQEITLPGILDMKWCNRSTGSPPILGIADAEGNITLHQWKEDEERVEEIQSVSCNSVGLCLSLDWANRRSPSSGLAPLITSLSDRTLCLLRPRDQTGLTVTDSWTAHDFEPWIAAWDYWNTDIIFSGGDDCKLKGWDARQGFAQPTFVNKRFEAGVTTIQSHPHVEHIIAVGSYDSTVSLFDDRKPLVPLVQANVGGGAWRVKWHPSSERKDDLLVACMHEGFKVLRFGITGMTQAAEVDCNWELVKRFDAHESLAYGVDWCYTQKPSREDKDTERHTPVASCSFYDHRLQLWRG